MKTIIYAFGVLLFGTLAGLGALHHFQDKSFEGWFVTALFVIGTLVWVWCIRETWRKTDAH